MDDIIRDFLAEATESMDALDRSLVKLEESPNDPELLSEIFRVMHTIKGTCGFLGLHRLASVAHAAEDVLGQFRDGALSPSQESVSAILQAVDLIKWLLAQLEALGHEPTGDDRALVQKLKAMAATPQAHDEPSKSEGEPLAQRIGGVSAVDCAVELALSSVKAKPEGLRFCGAPEEGLQASLRDCVWGLLEGAQGVSLARTLLEFGLDNPNETKVFAAALVAGLSELGVEPQDADAIGAILSTSDAAPSSSETPDVKSDAASSSVATQSIRVNVEALEQLMNVASELVLIRNQLLQTLRSQPESPFAAPLQRLNHVTTELQESVMTTRMQPISAAWAKLPRIARDLAVELNKRIEVVMQGAETELDRQVLEMIRDPLTHMIRNAADHGLEAPGERAKAGKPETGRILLAARHEGSHIVIEVSDDGRGLQPSKLRAKAFARGLITAAEAENLSDTKIQQLIFHPGFSTAEAVSGISGRGVGMDVVRTNIEKIGGTVELASTEGRGTRFTIRIPLTLTIVSALIVDCCSQRFAMPQSAVVELVGVGGGSGRAIETINGAPVLRLRDRLLPLVSLQELMKLDGPSSDDERSILVTRIGAFSFGIIVDRVFDTEEIVVKPAASILRSIPYYSGATILGDGAVIMILDPKGIATRIGSFETEQPDDIFVGQDQRSEHIQLLLVRSGHQSPKATPLQLVSRIEEVPLSSIEYANGKPVLQYRGRLMPLIGAEGETTFGEPWETRPVIVFDNQGRAIGLVVDEILDIVEAPLVREFKADRPGILGSLVIRDRVTDLLDLSYFWRLSAADTANISADAMAKPQRKALIVDPSPFQRNLVAPLLAMAGYRIVVSETTQNVASTIDRDGPFDVILADAASDDRSWINGLASPVIGLYDDPLAIRQSDAEGFTRLACRFDRDELMSSLEIVGESHRSAA